MSDIARRVREQVPRLRELAQPTSPRRSLRRRVAELEDEMQEARRLNRRLGELMDVMEELLIPISQRDEERVQRYLSSHSMVLDGPSSGGSAATWSGREPNAGGQAQDEGRDDPSGTG